MATKGEARNGGNHPSPEDRSSLQNADSKPSPNPQGQYHLALQQFDSNNISEFETAWLVKRGASFKALMGNWPVGAANVNFDGKGHFDLCEGDSPLPPPIPAVSRTG